MSRISAPVSRRSRSPESSQERDVRFAGYGDRIGSGVEFGPTYWKGGEIVTNPDLVVRSLTTIKPRRMFYSPIGDGVVASDGVEMKRGPVDLSPKVSITQTRAVERGSRGKGGVNIIEKTWTTPLPGEPGSGYYGSERSVGGDSGISRATTAASPFGSLADPLALGSNMGAPPAPTTSTSSYGTGGGSRPSTGLADPFSAPPSNYNTLTSRDPFDTLGSAKSEPYKSTPYVSSKPNIYANGVSDIVPAPTRPLGPRPPPIIESRQHELESGQIKRSSDLYEPGYRYEIKKDYMVTNPKELIHQYATGTPISAIPGYQDLPDGGVTTRVVKQSYSMKKEEMFAPYPPYHAGVGSDMVNPNKFVRQIRDEGLTSTQRQANLQKDPIVQGDIRNDRKIQEISHKTTRAISPHPEIDNLTDRLLRGLTTGHPIPPKY